ncbi:MAG: ABC transporter permease [Ruminococcaceae bacterium]|nr:ABC transporter permease [Oscillospiraceae bacterium]
MTKYLLSRLARGIISIVLVVLVVMILIYSLMNKESIFAQDPIFSKQKLNNKVVYQYQQWEKYGYLDYVSYADWLKEQLTAGAVSEEDYSKVVTIGKNADADGEKTSEFVQKFTEYYESKGYEVERLPGITRAGTKKYQEGGNPQLFAYKNIPVMNRVWDYFTGIITFDNIHYVKDELGERGLSFTLFDPAYGGEKFSPAIMGNGTKHKYLLYFDSQFPFIHQNFMKISLGTSYSVNQGVDVFDTMTSSQGAFKTSLVTYPTGLVENSADNLHTATYVSGSLNKGTVVVKDRYVDDYTSVSTYKNGFSKIGYSFVIGIISVAMAYVIALPLGVLMALKKDKFIDHLGTIYIIFIIAVPSLAYIFLFKAIGGSFGLPTTFDMINPTWLMYILPIISLALPSIANLMKWLRRYMIDQMNSDYVKFARSGGLSEGEIFRKHVLKNAAIPIIHGIPGSVLGSLVGAIITERVYVVPGAGNLLTNAINAYDNGVIVGVTLFYALLSVVSIICGDILMSMVDPRISFTTKKGR